MRSRALPISLAIIISILIAVGIVYSQKHGVIGTDANLTNPVPNNLPSVNPSGVQSGSPVPTTMNSSLPGGAVVSPSPGSSGSPQPVDLTVDTSGLSKTTAVFETTKGTFKFKFYAKDAPNTVARIIQLIQMGFYNGIIFHRVEPGFVVQTGDPTGTGAGGSGQKLKAEFNERRHIEGAVAMARTSDPDSADSQFYVTFGPQTSLDHKYTVFGQVIEGMDTIRKIVVGDKITSASLQ